MISLQRSIPALLLFAAALAGAGWYFGTARFGNAAVWVAAPAEVGLSVSADGGNPVTIPAWGQHRFGLHRGKHVLSVTPAGGAAFSRPVEVESGRDALVVPLPKQCFVLLDVSRWAYQAAGETARPVPELDHFVEEPQAFALPWAAYMSANDLPGSLGEHDHAKLLLPAACEGLNGLTMQDYIAMVQASGTK